MMIMILSHIVESRNGGVYLIYYDQSWYVTKNKSFNESDFLNVDSIKNAVSNTDQWLKIE